MATIDVKDAAGQSVTIQAPAAPGRAAATSSRPVVLSNEDKAVLDALNTALGQLGTQTTLAAILAKLSATPATETTSAAIKTAVDAVTAKLIAAPATEANQTGANTLLSAINTALGQLGTQATLAAILAKLIAAPATEAKQDAEIALSTAANAQIGIVTETAPASDTASSGLNGRLQRIAQRITGLIALLPASLGAKTGAASLSIVPATDAAFNIEASLRSGTATRTAVPSGITSVTILAANPARKSAVICNQDANALLLDFSAGSASATRYQERLTQGQSLHLADGFTGAVTGVWEADGSGQADVVEFV